MPGSLSFLPLAVEWVFYRPLHSRISPSVETRNSYCDRTEWTSQHKTV